MKRYWIGILIVVAITAVVVPGCCSAPKLSSVGVSLVAQHRDWWCWAATTEMISAYYGARVDQCDSANFIHGTPPDCCTGCTGTCPGWGIAWGATIQDIKDNWTHWNFSYDYVASELTWDELTETIASTPNCKKSPLQVVWWWTGGGGHVVTAYGYAEVGGQTYVSYFNPLPPDCARDNQNQCSSQSGGEDVVSTYAVFASSAAHDWGNTFSNFKKSGN